MKKIFILFLFSFLILTANAVNIADVIDDTASLLTQTVASPTVSQAGGEWSVIGLSRSGLDILPKYFYNYYTNLSDILKKNNGVLHARKNTEYSRAVLAVSAIGKNPRDVAGYDIISPLEDFDKTVSQGINGAIWALIAIDSSDHTVKEDIRGKYTDFILSKEIDGGGWALSGNTPDADITAMALQALSNYTDNEKVQSAVNRALDVLSRMQNSDGAFSAYGESASESCSQVIVALCELGISLSDERFVKNGKSALDGLMTFYTEGKGFAHIKGKGMNLMATEQAFYALVAAERAQSGKSPLYDMSDAKDLLAPKIYNTQKVPDKSPFSIFTHIFRIISGGLNVKN